MLYTNVYFQTVIGDITFVGYLNLVRRVPDLGIQVLSFNTSCQAPNPVYLERDFSISLCAHALWQGSIFPAYPDLSEEVRLETIPGVCVYYFPHLERYLKKVNGFKKGDRKGNPLMPVSRTQEQLFDFEYEVLYSVSGIQNDFFPMMPGTPARCSICSYAYICNSSHSVFAFDTSFNPEDFEKEDVA